MSALTNEANIPSSCSSRVSGLSYSKMFPRFITMTRSAVRMVWTRCCQQTIETISLWKSGHVRSNKNLQKEHAVVWFDTNQAVSGSKAAADPESARRRRKHDRNRRKNGRRRKDRRSRVVCAGPGLLVSPH